MVIGVFGANRIEKTCEARAVTAIFRKRHQRALRSARERQFAVTRTDRADCRDR
jgi:hypothetical protein